ncbi:aminoglycoside adenylyltransferase domain-containing protein [Salicibibacter kimchii]|uniref:aminoglycoside adenylyltransferase domain-containing protein n=1 Tax=Salicibibacter kimchii TaxID=2099786 RepID=UPI001D05680D|nr:aminoglycoside adenylyltransferase domain-containing protein [Salicibibacter kimchii]
MQVLAFIIAFLILFCIDKFFCFQRTWAILKLPKQQAEVLDIARKAYLGEYDDNWDGMEAEVMSLLNHMRGKTESGHLMEQYKAKAFNL